MMVKEKHYFLISDYQTFYFNCGLVCNCDSIIEAKVWWLQKPLVQTSITFLTFLPMTHSEISNFIRWKILLWIISLGIISYLQWRQLYSMVTNSWVLPMVQPLVQDLMESLKIVSHQIPKPWLLFPTHPIDNNLLKNQIIVSNHNQ